MRLPVHCMICTLITGASLSAAPAAEPVGESFTIGVYYAMPQLEPKDHFSWDYAFMDMARIGCDRIVVSGNCWANQWAALKNWGIKGITSYGELNNYRGPGEWEPADMEPGILESRDRLAGFEWNGVSLADTVIGHIMDDEPECRGLTEDEKNYLRSWADTYHRLNPQRKVYVNHCDPPWYDLNEKVATCSAAPTVRANGVRITDRIDAAQKIGLENFVTVALLGNITAWAAEKCDRIAYWDFGSCDPDIFVWLAERSNYQDAYEELLTAYHFGSLGFQPYMYNQHRAVSLVDKDGNDNYGIRSGFSDAAHDLRMSQGWPGVELYNAGEPFRDRGTYAAGSFVLTAEVVANAAAIEKVVFGKSIDGGSIWTSIEDSEAPYTATFATDAGKTVIFRARAVASDGRRSIFAANMITTENP